MTVDFAAAGLQARGVWVRVILLSLALAGCETRRAIPLTSSSVAPILLFDGAGTSPNDVIAVEKILDSEHRDYSTASSTQLDEMSEPRLRAYRLLIIPGGNFITMGEGLKASTTAKIRAAVRAGLSYLGICAGAFLAGHYEDHNSIDLTSGVKFEFYADERRGIRKAAVAVAVAGGPTLDQYWEDGPQLAGWGEVIARYPDRTPAIVEGRSDEGWVILSGIHPEAPESWRRDMTFATPARIDNAYAGALIHAALSRTRLRTF